MIKTTGKQYARPGWAARNKAKCEKCGRAVYYPGKPEDIILLKCDCGNKIINKFNQ